MLEGGWCHGEKKNGAGYKCDWELQRMNFSFKFGWSDILSHKTSYQ